jgi:lipopolysaccharide/colanic/teichoic acid biosynthesis glycosyltransferase
MYTYAKTFFDLLFGLLLIIVLLPLFILIGLLIKFSSPGPVFFIQERLGFKAKIFKMYKFRTMITNAPDIRNTDGTTFNSKYDPRVTRLGKLLRESSLDELPQLFNIIKFEMSFIGPRPELPESINSHTVTEMERLLIKPGITGLAQINGRNLVDIRKRRELDIEYKRRLNFILDFSILISTILMIVNFKTIYTNKK